MVARDGLEPPTRGYCIPANAQVRPARMASAVTYASRATRSRGDNLIRGSAYLNVSLRVALMKEGRRTREPESEGHHWPCDL